MSDSDNGFSAVVARLKLVLEVTSDAMLAERLGLGTTAWAQRKKRDSLPTKEIDALIASEELNPEFIYKGIGAVHLPIDGAAWIDGFHKRLQSVLAIETYRKVLAHNGYKEPALKKLLAAGQPPSVELLRDLHNHLSVDLNALVCDVPPIIAAERALLDSYRRSTEEGKRLVEQVATFAARQIAR